MVKRELTEEERKLEQLGLDRNTENLKVLKENFEYNKALLEKQEYLREFDDKWRDFLRRQKKIEDDQVLETIENEIKNKENLINTAKKHLKEGVDVKTPAG
jgi:hypothetical protein